MENLSDARPVPGSFAGRALTAALALVLAWQLAHWTWVFVAPAPVSQAPAARGDVDLAAIARLFGAAPPAAATTASQGTLRLKGVIAPTPGVAASAIFSTGVGKDLAVFVGNEVTPGTRLAEVNPDHVIVTREGVRSRIDLEARRASVAGAAPGSRTFTPGFRVAVARAGDSSYSFSRRELDEALRDPGQLNYLGQIGMPPGGGVRMELAPPGSLAQKLGLQPGDVIRRVNGQSVASTGDLARLYTQFNTLSSIQAEVVRGSQTMTLSYAIQP